MESKQLTQTCPRCDAPLVVIEESQPSLIVPGGRVDVPITRPVCLNGHDYDEVR